MTIIFEFWSPLLPTSLSTVSSVKNYCVVIFIYLIGILKGLLDNNFNQFIRVGSLKKIAKQVLPYTLHRERSGKDSEEKETQKAVKDLKVCLRTQFCVLGKTHLFG
jgi:hypothetical protein